ncbi:MAG TPA: class I SAM-dependent methyltransferase [Solirubrobacteraceae bacterium]
MSDISLSGRVLSLLRRVGSRIVPDSGKRAIDRVRMRRFLSIIAPANVEYTRRYGLQVKRGPFAGMHYLDGVQRTSADLISKLAGTYEAELHPAMEEWLRDGVSLVVNVGCAEGYYAVGLARSLPQSEVLAYDISAHARAQCAELAEINDVAERVSIRSECTPSTLVDLPGSNVALLCDCEGYEETLLDPDLAPTLRGWRILVELHDFVNPLITETITKRFAASHEVELIASFPAQTVDVPEFQFMTARQRWAALTERPVPMNWAHLRPLEPSLR